MASRATKVGMTATIARYHAMYFEDVAQAVDYCHALVPHIVSRSSGADVNGERAVVWFHVPRRSQGSTRDGCYLFASAGAIAAAERGGLDTPLCGRVTRAALPHDAVLLFGDDIPPTPPRTRSGRRPNGPRVVTETLSPASRPADVRA
jgi:hypothetical protein